MGKDQIDNSNLPNSSTKTALFERKERFCFAFVISWRRNDPGADVLHRTSRRQKEQAFGVHALET